MTAPLAVCFLTGLDRRRVDETHAPFLSRALARYPHTTVTTFPSSELSTTIFTGTYPGTHGHWHVRLRDDAPRPTPWWLRAVPDTVSTTIQGLLRAGGLAPDALATVPYRRLRQLEPRRYKYGARGRRRRDLLSVGGIPTLFAALGLGEGRARYRFHRDPATCGSVAPDMGRGRYLLDFLESRALDLLQHWSLDRADLVRDAYHAFDERLEALDATCRAHGTRLLVLSDHGHEIVRTSIDLRPVLRSANVPRDAFTHFVEPSLARFWVHDARARERLAATFAALPDVTMLDAAALARYHLDVADGRFGHFFLSPSPGVIFFPHDFHQPVANAFLALTDRAMRHRLRNPRLRGDHAYLPEHPSEKGFLVLFDEGHIASRDEITLVDIAPSILDLVGTPPPPHMKGAPAFRRATMLARP